MGPGARIETDTGGGLRVEAEGGGGLSKPLEQFLGVFSVGDPQNDDLGPVYSIVRSEVSAAKAVQRRRKAAEALEPGLSDGKRSIRQMSRRVGDDLDGVGGIKPFQIRLGRGAVNDPKLCGRHVSVSTWPAGPRR